MVVNNLLAAASVSCSAMPRPWTGLLSLYRCAHEQKVLHYALLLIGVATMANKKALFVTLVDRVPPFEAH